MSPLFYSVTSDENQEAKPKRYHERQRCRAKHTRAVLESPPMLITAEFPLHLVAMNVFGGEGNL